MSSRLVVKEEDKLDKKHKYRSQTEVKKRCWGCGKEVTEGYMVFNDSSSRMIFLCENCSDKFL
ncbi:MAG: hypothetical protein ACQERB_13945 [Promethearchaeati archaeon]